MSENTSFQTATFHKSNNILQNTIFHKTQHFRNHTVLEKLRFRKYNNILTMKNTFSPDYRRGGTTVLFLWLDRTQLFFFNCVLLSDSVLIHSTFIQCLKRDVFLSVCCTYPLSIVSVLPTEDGRLHTQGLEKHLECTDPSNRSLWVRGQSKTYFIDYRIDISWCVCFISSIFLIFFHFYFAFTFESLF